MTPIIRVLACSGLAIGLYPMLRAPYMAVFGVGRWLLVAALLCAGLLQIVLLAMNAAGATIAANDTALAAALYMLSVAFGMRYFMDDINRRSAEFLERKIEERWAQAQESERRSRTWWEMAEHMANVGHWRIEFPSQKLFWSDEIFRIHGLSKADFSPEINQMITAFHPNDCTMVRDAITRAVSERSLYQFEARLVRPDGEIRNVLSRGVTQTNEAGEVTGLFGVLLDITAQKRAEEELRDAKIAAERANDELRDIALVDALTEMPNLRRFDIAWAVEVGRAARENEPLAVMMIDIDNFKAYNDSFGHLAGDECLRLVAKAIAGVPRRPGDLVARYGGEEFAVLLPNTCSAGAAVLAEQVVQAIARLRMAHPDSRYGIVTVSCGVAVRYPGGKVQRAHELLESADRAFTEPNEVAATGWYATGGTRLKTTFTLPLAGKCLIRRLK